MQQFRAARERRVVCKHHVALQSSEPGRGVTERGEGRKYDREPQQKALNDGPCVGARQYPAPLGCSWRSERIHRHHHGVFEAPTPISGRRLTAGIIPGRGTMAGTGAPTSPPTRTYELHKECEQGSSAGLRNWDFTSLPPEPPSDSAGSGAFLI